MEQLNVKTHLHIELIDITSQVNQTLQKMNINEGVLTVYTPHTTAAITINENADPDVQTDLITAFRSFDFERLPFKHREGNSTSHALSSLVGCSENIIIDNGRLVLGTWQGIYFCEFDGPRNRKVYIQKAG
jgi:secondary thiamine-phosphate synthase enzyme